MANIKDSVFLFVKESIEGVSDRVRHPVFIVFLFSWPFFNWSFLYDVFISRELTKDLIVANVVNERWGRSFFYPLIWAFLVTFLYAPLKEISETCSTFIQNIVIKVRSQFLPASVVCKSKYDSTMKRLEKSILKNNELSIVNAGVIHNLEEEKKELQELLRTKAISLDEVTSDHAFLAKNITDKQNDIDELAGKLELVRRELKKSLATSRDLEDSVQSYRQELVECKSELESLQSQADNFEQTSAALYENTHEMQRKIDKLKKLSQHNKDVLTGYVSTFGRTDVHDINKLVYMFGVYEEYVKSVDDLLGKEPKNLALPQQKP